MLHGRGITALAAALLVTAACAGDTGDEELDESLAEQDTAAMQQPTARGDSAAALAMLGVDSTDAGDAYLTDADGRALYLIEGEPEGESTCSDACAEEWPPLLLTGGAAAGSGGDTAGSAIRAELVGTLQRPDGGTQVTYGGHALYYYHDDQEPGQISGQDLTDQWGEWYLVRPDGEPLEDAGDA